jgi:predicted PurR-regulated permease PerM
MTRMTYSAPTGYVLGYVLGNLLTSLIAGTFTWIFLVIVGVPYPLLLGIFVAIIDLLPVTGSIIAGWWCA